MESNDKSKEINIKNCPCYYSDDTTKIEDFHLGTFLIDEKSYENILVYNISNKGLIYSKPLRTRFDKIDEFNRVYDGTRYLVLFRSEKYDSIYNRIRYLTSVKNGIACIVSPYYAKIKVRFIRFFTTTKINDLSRCYNT